MLKIFFTFPKVSYTHSTGKKRSWKKILLKEILSNYIYICVYTILFYNLDLLKMHNWNKPLIFYFFFLKEVRKKENTNSLHSKLWYSLGILPILMIGLQRNTVTVLCGKAYLWLRKCCKIAKRALIILNLNIFTPVFTANSSSQKSWFLLLIFHFISSDLMF